MTERMIKPTLLYIYDPMCSWCWGYRATWQTLQEKISSIVEIKYLVGGLAADSDEPMPEKMQQFLQQTWHNIAEKLGCEFNFDFWSNCQARRSTYPACRAVIALREHGLEQAMCLAIQQGYYLQAKNPSDNSTLIAMATSIGLDANAFEQSLNSETVNQQLLTEIALVKQLPINGFPSLVLAINNQYIPIELDYKHWQTSYNSIITHVKSN
jgi:putative protein-disulfide isomerase